MKFRQIHHTIDTLFLLVLFAIFATGSLLVSIFGANQYKTTVNTMDKNHETRTCTSYIREKIHQTDNNGTIFVCDEDGISVLVLPEIIAERSYATYIYVYQGWIYEVLLSSDTEFTLGSGQKILEADAIQFDIQNPHLLFVSIVQPDKTVEQISISVKTDILSQEKGE